MFTMHVVITVRSTSTFIRHLGYSYYDQPMVERIYNTLKQLLWLLLLLLLKMKGFK